MMMMTVQNPTPNPHYYSNTTTTIKNVSMRYAPSLSSHSHTYLIITHIKMLQVKVAEMLYITYKFIVYI